MTLPDNVTLRPHHLALLADYKGYADKVILMHSSKYGPETATRFARLFQALYDSPQTRITIVDEPDSICALCHNLVDGKCQTSTDEQLARTDKDKREAYSIRKKEYTVEEAYELGDQFFGMQV